MSQVSVVVIGFDTPELLRGCLTSVIREGATEVVVVENGPGHASAGMVRAEFPGVAVEHSGTNLGYGAAANAAIARCTSDHVLLLNADTVVHPGALEALGRYLDEHPRVAVVGPRLLNPDGSEQASCFPFPGTLRWLLENDPVAPLAARLPRLRRTLLRFSPPTRPAAVPWVLGAALALRREAFAAVGGFDPTFFMYFEEVDLCLRLTSAGWEVHVLPEARVTHAGGASTSRMRSAMIVEHFRSTLTFYRRHYGGARRAAWLTLMRTKMALRIARDGVAMAVQPGRRPALEEDLAAWWRALRETGRRADVAPGADASRGRSPS